MTTTETTTKAVDSTAIRVDNLSKDFKLYHEKSMRHSIINSILGRTNYEILHVLKNVSFEVKAGEMVGIIGKNGAGKSTLLRILAGILRPTAGTVTVNGKLIPFLGLGVGFVGDLSAIDNIILYGIILGFSKKEITNKVPDILKYAELERFGDTPIRNFSSGMHARLAFSTAMLVDPDILLLDEVLAVGDIDFKKKSFEAFLEMKKKKKTIILVTHSLKQVTKQCDRAILLHEGKVYAEGLPEDVVKAYLEVNKKPLSSRRRTEELDLLDDEDAAS